MMMVNADTLAGKQLGDRIFLFFYREFMTAFFIRLIKEVLIFHRAVLSSALRLGLPLPDNLPNTEYARQRMIAKVNEFRLEQVGNAPVGNEDEFVLFYSFILATLSINEGLLQIIAAQQQIYGTVEDEALSI
ncbi:hypothetical protein V1509DRAFT_617580 [Lipomyces kononenkoae]